MVIYEVNVTVDSEIFVDYHQWLIKHMEDMLKFRGFNQAEILTELSYEDSNDKKKLTIRYLIECEDDLNNYFNNHARIMRAESINKFGDKLSAFRRVFLEPSIYRK